MIKYMLRDSLKMGLIVLLVLALIQPFGIDKLEEGRIPFILGQTVISVMGIFISFFISTALFGIKRTSDMTWPEFIRYTLIATVVNVSLLAVALISFNSWFHEGDPLCYWFWEGHFTIRPFFLMSMYVGSISVIVVLFQCYDYRNKRLKSELDEVKAINQLLEERQEMLTEVEENNDIEAEEECHEPVKQEQLVTIEGQGIGATLRVNPANIIYVESMANYADICYIADNETKHTTLRITLKQIRASLEAVDSIVQCHRAFLVNLDFVVALSSRNQGYQLQLFGIEKQIPVSRANTEAIKSKLAVTK